MLLIVGAILRALKVNLATTSKVAAIVGVIVGLLAGVAGLDVLGGAFTLIPMSVVVGMSTIFVGLAVIVGVIAAIVSVLFGWIVMHIILWMVDKIK